jgi:hypothetical protein
MVVNNFWSFNNNRNNNAICINNKPHNNKHKIKKMAADQVLIGINQNLPFTPEMAYQIKQAIEEVYSVEATVIPSPTAIKPVEATSSTIDSATLISIEQTGTTTLMPLLG